MNIVFHEECFILAEKTQSAGIANSLTGDTLGEISEILSKQDMKVTIYILLTFIIVSCSNPKKDAIVKTEPNAKIENRDSVQKSSEIIFQAFKKSKFQSESEQDEFYIHYADSLKKNNGYNNPELREKMIKAFIAVNELHSRLNYGGTFYGHQNKRLLAEVEYSISKKQDERNSKNSFLLKKKEYLKNWINYIEKKENENVYNQIDTIGAKKRAKELEIILDKIQTSISNQFILDEVINFESQYYK